MNRKNRIWQSLMRQGLVAATACVIVTDQARMASEAETAIVRDMLKSDLDGAHVCIVVTKTESLHGKPEDQEALRRRASEIFGVEENRVICTGTTDEDYVAEWLPQLKILSGKWRLRERATVRNRSGSWPTFSRSICPTR